MLLLMIFRNFVIIPNKISVGEIISKGNANFGDKISDKLSETMENSSCGSLKWLGNL